MVVRYCILLFVAALGSSATIKNPEERLIDGYTAPEGTFPYQAAIQYERFPWCGGSIIAKDWILTAASCVEGIPMDILSVQVGTFTPRENGSKILQVINHGEYDKFNGKNNVALLKVEPLAFTESINAVALDENPVRVPELLLVSSFGNIFYHDRHHLAVNFNLTFLLVYTRKTEFCKIFTYLEENDVCASALQRQGVCGFSIGSPLIRDTENGLKQVGIASRGFCGHDSDIYVGVAPYIPWIKEKCDNCI